MIWKGHGGLDFHFQTVECFRQGKWSINSHYSVQLQKTQLGASVQQMATPLANAPSRKHKTGSWSSAVADWGQEWTPAPRGSRLLLTLQQIKLSPGPQRALVSCARGALGSMLPFQAGYLYQGSIESFQIIIKERTRENEKWENWGGEEGHQGGREVETDNRNRDGRPWICWFLPHQAPLYSLSCGSLMYPCSLPRKYTSLVQQRECYQQPHPSKPPKPSIQTPSIQTFCTSANHLHPNSCEENCWSLHYKTPHHQRVFYWVGKHWIFLCYPIFEVYW